jgi:lipopolysaccharide biosynthesis regulator YciM
MGQEEAVSVIIKSAVDATEGRLQLANAQEFIIGELERNRFNTERAIEIHTFAIDRSVWSWVKDLPLGRLMFKEYLQSGLGKRHAIDIVERFKVEVGGSYFGPLKDQPPTRRFLRFLLGA